MRYAEAQNVKMQAVTPFRPYLHREMYSLRFLFRLLLAIPVFVTFACSSEKTVYFNTDAINALRRIYEESAWTFQQARLEIQVHEGGAAEIRIVGQALRKDDGGDGILWLPFVCMEELPTYFEGSDVTEVNAKHPLELQAYKIAGGPWCITAPVPLVGLGSQSAVTLQLQFLMVSPLFTSNLPLVFPPAQSQGTVTTTITLPKKGLFVSSDVGITAYPLEESTKIETPSSVKLISMPPSITGGEVRAVARLTAKPGVSWNFSKVRFDSVGFGFDVSFRWSVFGLYVVIICWLMLELFPLGSRTSNQKYHDSGTSDYPQSTESYKQKSLILNQLRFSMHTEWRYRRFLAAVAIGLVMTAILSILVPWAFGQVTKAKPRKASGAYRGVTLGELGITVEGKTSSFGRLNVALDFFALTASADAKGLTEIGIGVVENSPIDIEELKVSPTDRVKIIQQSRKLTRLSVPGNITTAPLLFKTLAGLKIEQFSLPDSYLKNLKANNFVKLQYLLGGAVKTADLSSGGWFYWFPFETNSIEIPLQMHQSAIVSKIEIQRPADFVGDVTSLAFPSSFTDTNGMYQLDLRNGPSRVNIPAGEKAILKVQLRRTWFQRLVLTLGQLLIAVASGVLLGWVATLPDKSPLTYVIQIVGILGLPLLIRASVFSTYKDLPTLLSGQPPTIFEIVFLVSWIVYAAVTVIVWRRCRP